MGKLIYSIMISLDGFMETEDHSLDWVIVDEEVHTFVNNLERPIHTYLDGRRTHEIMQAFWPTAHLDPENPDYIVDYAHIWQGKNKVVFSRTLEHAEGARLVRENMVEEVARLKAETDGDLGMGGAEVAAQLMEAGLVDEYRLFINPVLLGRGTPAFRSPEHRAKLRLLETRTFSSGVVYMRYENDTPTGARA